MQGITAQTEHASLMSELCDVCNVTYCLSC